MVKVDLEEESLEQSNNNSDSENPQKEHKKKRSRTGGKPKGWRKPPTKMNNGRFIESDLYKYVPKETLPKEQVERFLNLCDSMIMDLGVETLSESDLEEISLYYRERVYCDLLYQQFASAGGTTDTTMILHIEKLNKALEQRKSNLGTRFIDKGKKRKDNNTSTLMEILSNYNDNQGLFTQVAESKDKDIDKNREMFTSTSDYMLEHLGSRSKKS